MFNLLTIISSLASIISIPLSIYLYNKSKDSKSISFKTQNESPKKKIDNQITQFELNDFKFVRELATKVEKDKLKQIIIKKNKIKFFRGSRIEYIGNCFLWFFLLLCGIFMDYLFFYPTDQSKFEAGGIKSYVILIVFFSAFSFLIYVSIVNILKNAFSVFGGSVFIDLEKKIIKYIEFGEYIIPVLYFVKINNISDELMYLWIYQNHVETHKISISATFHNKPSVDFLELSEKESKKERAQIYLDFINFVFQEVFNLVPKISYSLLDKKKSLL